jgi:hypothetical protein
MRWADEWFEPRQERGSAGISDAHPHHGRRVSAHGDDLLPPHTK